MRRLTPTLVAGLWLCASAVYAAPSYPRGVIQEAYSVMDAGLIQKNVAKACAYLAPDFTNTFATGVRQNLARFQLSISAEFAEFATIHARSVVQGVSSAGQGRVVVTVRQIVSLVYLNPNTLGRSNVIEKDVARDVWVKTGHGWMQLSSRNLLESETTDGRPGGPIL